MHRECLYKTLKTFSTKHIVTRGPWRVKKKTCKTSNTTYSYSRSFLKFITLLSSWTWLSQSKFSEMHRHSTGLVTHTVSSVTEKCVFLCFVDRASLYIRVMKTNLMQYLSSVCFVNQPLHVSGIFVAHHQKVCCIYTRIRTCCAFQLTVCWPSFYKYVRNM